MSSSSFRRFVDGTFRKAHRPDRCQLRLEQLDDRLAPALLGPTPYLSFANSPLNGPSYSYFFLEDFEDDLLNVPGVTASAGGVTGVVFGPSIHDSVDADDGVIDGSGLNGESFFSGNGAAGIRFTFNAANPALLGNLPTHVGIVWTDGAGQTTFEAFDSTGASLGTVGPVAIADGSFSGTTAEDRFFGVTHPGGISAIRISNTAGGIEVDHLQYGFVPSNQAPTAKAGGPYTVAEGGSVQLDGSGSSDPEQASGTLIYEWDFNGDGVFGDATGMKPTFSAAGLDGPSSVTVGLRVTDGAGATSATSTAIISITNAVPTANNDAANTNEDTAVTINVLGNDTDVPGDPLTVVSVGSTANGGTVAINANGTLTYTPLANFFGTDTFSYTIGDGDGGSATATVTVTVNPVNDAPVNGVPGPLTTDEDTDKVIANESRIPIRIADVDAGANQIQVQLGVTNGTLTLSGTNGLTFNFDDRNGVGSGDGTADATMTFRGTLSAINGALSGMFFRPSANYNGRATIQITTNDLGNTGSGNPLIDSDTVEITVNPVNDAPTLEVPGATTPPTAQIAHEDVDLTLSRIGVGDVDDGQLTVTLDVAHGTLSLTTTAGLRVDGNGTGRVRLAGTIADLNAGLAGVIYRGTINYSGPDTLIVTASDASLSTTANVAITVKSAAQQAADMQGLVTALETQRVLNAGQARSLNAKLNLRGSNGDGGLVQSFLNQVNSLFVEGVLTESQAAALLGPGNILLLSVTRR